MFATNQFTGFLAIARRYRFSRTILFGLLIITALFGFYASANPVEAQSQPLVWTPQQRIPGYLDRTEQPILIADSTGIVHAFAYQEVNNPNETREVAIIYSTWSYEAGWTLPTDIILSPIKRQARVMDVYLDAQGVFHLIFYGGDEQEAYLYYSRAHISDAWQASSWLKPVIIGERPLTPSRARLTGAGKDNLLALYSGNLDGPGLFLINSADGGNTWSNPQPFFLTYNRFHRPLVIDWRWGDSGTLHLVWQIANDIGHNISGYYTQFSLQSGLWRQPIEIDEPIAVERGMGLAEPSVVEYKSEIFVMYNNGIPPTGVPPGQWFRRSSDGGQSWSIPVRPFPRHVGRNGAGSFVVDSNGLLHVFFGQRTPQGSGLTDIHGMWHSTWQGTSWSEPEAVVSRPVAPDFDPGNNHAVVSRGNVILVAWRTDPGKSKPGVWYSYTTLNSPGLPVVALPTVPIAKTNIDIVSDSASTSSRGLVLGADNDNATGFVGETDLLQSRQSPVAPFSAGSIAATVLVGITVLAHYLRKRGDYR